MKVYVLTIEEVYDYELDKQQPKLFYTRDDARAALKRCRDKMLESIHGLTWIIETDEADNFEAFELGRAAANRSSACINECEVMGENPPFFKRFEELKREEIDGLRNALAKAGGSFCFENTFIKVLACLGDFSEDYEFCIVRSVELDVDRIYIEVEANCQTYTIDADDVMCAYIHYITEEIEA